MRHFSHQPSLVLTALIVAWMPAAALAQGDANQSSCGTLTETSSGFRSSLPDCRAYELVTPPAKNGQPPATNATLVSPDGDSLSFASIGAFDTANASTAEGGEYVAKRTDSGWTTVSVNPSAVLFQNGSPEIEGASHETIDYKTDLTQTLFLKPPKGVKPVDARFYRRDVETGAFAELGSLLSPETVAAWTPATAEGQDIPPTVYAGASQDLSKILFRQGVRAPELLSWFWPGDKTFLQAGRGSLYEYGEPGASEPELVGVENNTTLVAAAAAEHKSHVNEAAHLISECGTAIGGLEPASGSTADAYNAISASGDTVYFTALSRECESGLTGPPVPELFARLNRERTVAISEPSTGPNGDCPSCDETEPKGGLFQGASQDGTKAFFLSEQALFGGSSGETGLNLYEYEFDAPEHEKVSVLGTDLPINGGGTPSGVLRVSEQGNYIFFVSHAALTGNANEFGLKAVAGPEELNLYVTETNTSQTTFIAGLSPQDARAWQIVDEGRRVEATANGNFLLFPSVANLTPDSSGESRQLYRYEVPTASHPAGTLVRVSIGAEGDYECPETKTVEAGFNCDGNGAAKPSSVFSPTYQRNGERGFVNAMHVGPSSVAITATGSEVFFESPSALTPRALNDQCAVALSAEGECFVPANNVYEWSGGQIYLLSDGRDQKAFLSSSSTKLIGADPSGANLFFISANSLVGQDTDTQVDVYDARMEGGFPGTAAPVACSPNCQPASSSPSFPLTPTSTLVGSGNLQPAPAITPTKPAKLTKAQLLANALKACRRDHARKNLRARCEQKARRKYGKASRKVSKRRKKGKR